MLRLIKIGLSASVLLMLVACGTSSKDTDSKEAVASEENAISQESISLGVFQEYANSEGTGETPTISHYKEIGIDLDENKLEEANRLIAGVSAESITSANDIETLLREAGIIKVDSSSVLLPPPKLPTAHNNDTASSTNPASDNPTSTSPTDDEPTSTDPTDDDPTPTDSDDDNQSSTDPDDDPAPVFVPPPSP